MILLHHHNVLKSSSKASSILYINHVFIFLINWLAERTLLSMNGTLRDTPWIVSFMLLTSWWAFLISLAESRLIDSLISGCTRPTWLNETSGSFKVSRPMHFLISVSMRAGHILFNSFIWSFTTTTIGSTGNGSPRILLVKINSTQESWSWLHLLKMVNLSTTRSLWSILAPKVTIVSWCWILSSTK